MKAKRLTPREFEVLDFAINGLMDVQRDRAGQLWQGGEVVGPKTWKAIRRYFRRDGNYYRLTEAGVRKARTKPQEPLEAEPEYGPLFVACPTCGKTMLKAV